MTSRCCLIISFLMGLSGCGGGSADKLDRHVVAGNVKLDGKPLDTGTIQFSSPKGTEHAMLSGAAIKNGAYRLPQKVGLSPGSYVVSISSSPPAPPPPSDPDEAMKAAAEAKPTKELIPAKYNIKTELKVEVEATGETIADFDLKSDSK